MPQIFHSSILAFESLLKIQRRRILPSSACEVVWLCVIGNRQIFSYWFPSIRAISILLHVYQKKKPSRWNLFERRMKTEMEKGRKRKLFPSSPLDVPARGSDFRNVRLCGKQKVKGKQFLLVLLGIFALARGKLFIKTCVSTCWSLHNIIASSSGRRRWSRDKKSGAESMERKRFADVGACGAQICLFPSWKVIVIAGIQRTALDPTQAADSG